MNPHQIAVETTKNIKIVPPKGFEIDQENSTFGCIKFKPSIKRWRDQNDAVSGYYLNGDNVRLFIEDDWGSWCDNHDVFATKKQAKSALAMAQISQIIDNDPRFGGSITDKEWADSTLKYCIVRHFNRRIAVRNSQMEYYFLAFHTREQRDLFLAENEDLIKDYLMLE